jgi:hypothetical protein
MVLSLMVLSACNSNVKTEDATYISVLTALYGGTEIQLYDENGSLLGKKTLKDGGMMVGGFNASPVFQNGLVYMTSPLQKNGANNYAVALDMKQLKFKKINSAKGHSPTSLTVDESSAYMAGSGATGAKIVRTDLTSNKPALEAEFDGVLTHELVDEQYLYGVFVADENNSAGTETSLRILDKQTLALVQEIPLAAFGVHDGAIVNGLFKKDDVLFVLSSTASLFAVNLSASEVKTITMPYDMMVFTGYDIAYDDQLFMFEQSHEDNTKVLRYDIATEKFDE